MRQAFAAAVIAGVTLAGVGPGEMASQPGLAGELCAADVREADGSRLRSVAGTVGAEVCAATMAINGYWESQGVGAAANVPVVFLHRPQDGYECRYPDSTETLMDAPTTNEFCYLKNTVVLSEQGMMRLAGGDSRLITAAAWYVTGHEKGHTVQQARGVDFMDIPEPIKTYSRRSEGQADCLSGVALHAVNAPVVPDAEKAVGNTRKRDPLHPSPRQRQGAFMLGANGTGCAITTLEQAGTVPPEPDWKPHVTGSDAGKY